MNAADGDERGGQDGARGTEGRAAEPETHHGQRCRDPVSRRELRQRSHAESKNIAGDQRGRAGAEECAGLRVRDLKPAAIAATASAAKTSRDAAFVSPSRVLPGGSWPIDWAVSSERGVACATARSDHNTQSTAATMPPNAPAMSDSGDTIAATAPMCRPPRSTTCAGHRR